MVYRPSIVYQPLLIYQPSFVYQTSRVSKSSLGRIQPGYQNSCSISEPWRSLSQVCNHLTSLDLPLRALHTNIKCRHVCSLGPSCVWRKALTATSQRLRSWKGYPSCLFLLTKQRMTLPVHFRWDKTRMWRDLLRLRRSCGWEIVMAIRTTRWTLWARLARGERRCKSNLDGLHHFDF